MVPALNIEEQSAYYVSVSKIGSGDTMRNKVVMIPALSEIADVALAFNYSLIFVVSGLSR